MRSAAELVEAALGAHRAGYQAEAEALYLQVLSLQPKHPMAGHNLALLLSETGRRREAVRRLDRLVKAAPLEPSLHLLIGRLLGEEAQTTRSLFHLRRSLALAPDRLTSWLEAVASAARQGRTDDAEGFAREAMGRFPGRAEIAVEMAIGLLETGRPAEARGWLERALALEPGNAPALYNLAALAQSEQRWAAALDLFRRAWEADRDGVLPRTCLGDLQLRLGDVEGAVASLDAWLADNPGDGVAISNRLMAEQYRPGVTAPSLHRLHAMWQARIGAGLLPSPAPVFSWRRTGRLRVGLVSGDLRMHPVGIFIIRGIEALDRSEIEMVVYSGSSVADAMTERFRRCAVQWRDVAGWTDSRLAETVRQDGIDVLVDLAGHTTDIRLGVFARRAAPVQVSWAGYFGTTGCREIDHLIGDARLVPTGEENCYSETVARLPDGYLCYDPPADAPLPGPLPEGFTRFAAFHHPAKINPDMALLWARILKADPEGGASLHFIGDGYDMEETQDRIRGWFAAAGISDDRLHFAGRLTRMAYYEALSTMHVALDPLPYSGGAITCDALWMGLPVVTMAGQSWAGRHSQTHLLAAGLDELVAQDADDYVRIATGLMSDRAGLATLRASLRERVAASALCDGAKFGAGLSALLLALRPSSTLVSTA